MTDRVGSNLCPPPVSHAPVELPALAETASNDSGVNLQLPVHVASATWSEPEQQGGGDVAGQAPEGAEERAEEARSRGDDGRIRTRVVTDSEKHDAQQQLDQYRRRLSRDMERRDPSTRGMQVDTPLATRVSPIREERSTSPPSAATAPSAPPTSSTESGHTIRGGMTPGLPARTPSYPFPRMVPPGSMHQNLYRPFTSMSPMGSANPAQGAPRDDPGLHESVLSDPNTPASTVTFLPPGVGSSGDRHGFPSPNLYELSLMLSAEPGLNAWWNAVVQIMVEVYQASRVTLAVPADTTDIDNVPWGQKATFNGFQEDDLSVGYLARGSSFVPSTNADLSEYTPQGDEMRNRQENRRPSLQTRHSFTSFENQRETKQSTADRGTALPRRPNVLPRSKSYLPASSGTEQGIAAPADHVVLNRRALEQHDAEEEQIQIPSWEAPPPGESEGRGRVLPVLQALDYEADPLIDHAGVTRVLDRGSVIALTRSYPYLDPTTMEATPAGKRAALTHKKRFKKPRADTAPKLGSILGGARPLQPTRVSGTSTASEESRGATANGDDPGQGGLRPVTPKYEEFEQAPPSPWSQSPAPSPAARAEPSENTFFTDAVVDEETFNPGSSPQDYSSARPPEAIGVNNSWTVLHVPLPHILLSKSQPVFRLDSTNLEQRFAAHGRGDLGANEHEGAGPFAKPSNSRGRERNVPIAILSILSPVIPYPSNLRHSLEHLAPHLATSFSLCRHYSNLENELQGLQRRRPHPGGFGAVDPDGRMLVAYPSLAATSPVPAEDFVSQQSLAGSITSPSDYSQPSRSTAGSPIGTPGWETSTLGRMMEKRAVGSSPAQINADSYFAADPRVSQGKREASSTTTAASRRESPVDKRSSLRLSASKLQDMGALNAGSFEPVSPADSLGQGLEDLSAASARRRRSMSRDSKDHNVASKEERRAEEMAHQHRGDDGKRKPGVTGQLDSSKHTHTHLHSYGADFASTFQSLPPSATVWPKTAGQTSAPSRSGSISHVPVDLPPPSDKLKGLMLDSLPAHVFVALPYTGEIVWVNSRYLTYRGQTAGDLANDPWSSLHPDDRGEYLRAWGQSVRTGEQFSRTVRIRRFDGVYRWFYARAIASRDKRGVIMQFLGSYMDIHDQHIAELKAARQEEIEASEAKHRLLANLIPQIIFTATEDEGITFANDQWLSYSGQSFETSLGLGFLDYVHPDDLAKCRIPSTSTQHSPSKSDRHDAKDGQSAETGTGLAPPGPPESSFAAPVSQSLSRNNSSSSSSATFELSATDLAELARKGVVKLATDSSGRLSYTTEVRLRTKDGEYRWHLVRCVEIDNVDFGNGASSYFGSATDINDLKLLEAKLKEAMDSKGRFLSNMSHEIRTPLIGISGMVSFLQDTTLNEEQRDYTNTIQTSANSLLMIINDILDLSRVDAGMMKLNYEWFHIRSLIEDVNELVSTMAIAKGLELNYVVDEDVPSSVRGDKVRIRQVLLNIIGNAIKFTTEGEVFSRCRVVTPEAPTLSEDEIMLEFSIIDTGRGFTKDEADLIFKPFGQIDGSSTRQHGGSGLGLVISRQLVELHGGRMEGSAVPGKGSTFTFTARFGQSTSADRPGPSAPAASEPRAGDQRSTHPFAVASVPPTPLVAQVLTGEPLRGTPDATSSPMTDAEVASSAMTSSGSSGPSIQSAHSRGTERSSASSVNMHAGLNRFSEAACASSQDLSQMKLEMPSERSSEGPTPTPSNVPAAAARDKAAEFQVPPMYSILVISPQTHSREATVKHIKMTLPKSIPHQITALASAAEATKLIDGRENPVIFTHIVVNLPSPEEVVSLVDRVLSYRMMDNTVILILSDSVQRQTVTKMIAARHDDSSSIASTEPNEDTLADISRRVTYIYKPVKPSRFAVIFDPAKERDLSIDRNRSTAQRVVETQKQSYLEMERRMGNRGLRVLLVEDNPINQKVLRKYLKKVGLEVEVAGDGVECTEKVFGQPHEYYSLILCDLHMPRKDGYQTCRDIRDWETQSGHPRMPVIALSANVMADVQDKCVAAGFSDYVTKPVDFIKLSTALSRFF